MMKKTIVLILTLFLIFPTLICIDVTKAQDIWKKEGKAYKFNLNKWTEIEIDEELPVMKLKRWNSYLKVGFTKVSTSPTALEKEKLKWANKTVEVHFYNLGHKKYQKKGWLHPIEEWSFEQEIILKEKPTSNILSLDIELKGLKYEKQDGGYVFYREIEMPDIVPEEQREILRENAFYLNPIVVRDKEGKETKAKIDLKDGVLAIEIDKNFLNKAVYPISIDPSYTIKTGASTSSTKCNNQQKLARKSNGDLWCVYYRSDGTYSQIYASYSTDGGETWTEEQVCSGSDNQYNPSIAIDSSDNIHVVWYGKGWGS